MMVLRVRSVFVFPGRKRCLFPVICFCASFVCFFNPNPSVGLLLISPLVVVVGAFDVFSDLGGLYIYSVCGYPPPFRIPPPFHVPPSQKSLPMPVSVNLLIPFCCFLPHFPRRLHVDSLKSTNPTVPAAGVFYPISLGKPSASPFFSCIDPPQSGYLRLIFVEFSPALDVFLLPLRGLIRTSFISEVYFT